MGIISLELRFWIRAQWLKYVKRARYQPEMPIFFIHIPKTAGTSFRNMLFRLIDQEVAFPNLEDLGQNEGNYFSLEKITKDLLHTKRDVRFFTGHFPFAVGEILQKPVQYYVFLRAPIPRTVSNLLHFQRNIPENKGLTLIEVFEKHRAHLRNLQTRYLSIPSMDRMEEFYRTELITKNHLELAKANLEKCTFVGITEKFPESVRLAEMLLQAKLGHQLKRNVAPIPVQDKYEPELIETISPFLELDQELYQHALQLFEKQQTLILKK